MQPGLVRIAGGQYVGLGPTEELAIVLNAKAAPQKKITDSRMNEMADPLSVVCHMQDSE